MSLKTGYAELSGFSMVLAFIVFLAGGLLFISRPDTLAQDPTSSRFIVERILILTAVILTAIGLILLEEHLSKTAGGGWTRIGSHLYLMAGVVLLCAETLRLSHWEQIYPLVVTYVLLAFLAQAAIGLGITQSEMLPSSVGWLTLGWNIAWLVILLLVTPADIYYPVLHHMMPLVMGLSLLRSK
jgi:hypothetical protein